MNTKIIKILALLEVLTAPMFLSPPAHAGNESGHGGDPVAQQFVQTARDVLARLSDQSNSPIALNLNAFGSAIESTAVESTDQELKIAGVHKACINYPSQKKIEVSRKDWPTDPFDRNRQALVLHEYLGIMGVDDQNYAVSGLLLGRKFLKLSCLLSVMSTPSTLARSLHPSIYPTFDGGISADPSRIQITHEGLADGDALKIEFDLNKLAGIPTKIAVTSGDFKGMVQFDAGFLSSGTLPGQHYAQSGEKAEIIELGISNWKKGAFGGVTQAGQSNLRASFESSEYDLGFTAPSGGTQPSTSVNCHLE